jgi:hypothetical protein
VRFLLSRRGGYERIDWKDIKKGDTIRVFIKEKERGKVRVKGGGRDDVHIGGVIDGVVTDQWDGLGQHLDVSVMNGSAEVSIERGQIQLGGIFRKAQTSR